MSRFNILGRRISSGNIGSSPTQTRALKSPYLLSSRVAGERNHRSVLDVHFRLRKPVRQSYEPLRVLLGLFDELLWLWGHDRFTQVILEEYRALAARIGARECLTS